MTSNLECYEYLERSSKNLGAFFLKRWLIEGVFKMQRKSNEKGFSLIELMIVVVIIGVLAGVGVPQYQKFQMKARQSEVKTLLGVMFTAQNMFYNEWKQYYSDFKAVGFSVEGDLGYNLGFISAGVKGPSAHPSSDFKNKNATIKDTKKLCSLAAVNCTIAKARTSKLVSGTVANVEDYSFGGASNIDGDPNLDEWTINENKKFAQKSDDIMN